MGRYHKKEIYLRPPLDFYISRMAGEFLLLPAAQICSCVSVTVSAVSGSIIFMVTFIRRAGRRRHIRNAVQCVNKEEHMAIFTGAGVAIITPFHEDGSVNYEKFAEHIEAQIAGGTDAIIVCGTTGEASTLTHEEHLEVIRFCVEQTAGRIPVIAGTGSNCTQTAVYLSQEAEKAGVDGVLVVTPYYNKATQKGLYEHFKIVAEAIHVPMILYNIPGRTGGVNILPETVVRLCREVPNIVGVKDATGNISQVAQLMSMTGEDVDLYSGNDDQVVPLLSLGGKGVISVLSNVAPRQTHDMCARFFAGDVAGSREIQLKAIPLCKALFCEVNPIPVKKALNLMGMEAGPLRSPLTEMTDANAAKLAEAMKNYGIKLA